MSLDPIPDDGELSGTLFIEIDDADKLREWLPKLVGIQRALRFELGDGSRAAAVPEDEERLTREETTATVHYLKFPFTPSQQQLLARGPARLVVDHPSYQAVTELSDDQRAALSTDFAE